MTSTLPPVPRSDRGPSWPPAEEAGAGLAHSRPLVAVSVLGGLTAAAGPLVVCLAVGVVGWFLSDSGAHGSPSGALRVGALGWLMGHGSGVSVGEATITAVPLGLTMLIGWALWRTGHRVGDAIADHGPDLDGLADGERDLVVPLATALFTTAYVVVAVLVATLAGTAATRPSTAAVVVWSVLLCALAGGWGIAVGSGRAALWLERLPAVVRVTLASIRTLVLGWLLVSALALLAALIVDIDTALNVMSQLHTDAGATTLYTLLAVLALPNGVLFSSAYLLGPGFAFGAGTVVSPTAVSLGALPMFPLLAALPDGGPTPAWTPALMASAPLLAIVVVVRWQRRVPTRRWDHGLLRGTATGVVAGLIVGALTLLSGGAIGPGRMAVVGPDALEVTGHAVALFGLAGLLAAAVMTWWQRRTLSDDDLA